MPSRKKIAARPRAVAPAQTWCAYLLRCGDGSLYAGITNDLRARLRAHRSGTAAGARYTRGRGPLRVVWRQAASDRSEASRIEWRLKRMKRPERLVLVRERGRVELSP